MYGCNPESPYECLRTKPSLVGNGAVFLSLISRWFRIRRIFCRRYPQGNRGFLRGRARKSLFGQDSLNKANPKLEGAWGTKSLVLGGEVDSDKEIISAPAPKIEGSRVAIVSGEFGVGGHRVRSKSPQVLRVYMQRWLVASMFWGSCVQPEGRLMTYCAEDQMLIIRPNRHICSGYWAMLRLLQSLAQDQEVWHTTFRNFMAPTLALRRRFPGPRISEELFWVTTDSAPEVFGVADWESRHFWKLPDGESAKSPMGEDGRLPGVFDKALMGLVVGIVAGFADRPEAVLLVGVDNPNAFCWAVRGETRSKFARHLLIAFLFRCVRNNVDVVEFYLRTNHSVNADEITRAPEEMPHWWGGR